MSTRPGPVRIGLSARLFHPEQDGRGIKTKTLQVLEQSVAHWVMARDVLVLMVPTIVSDGTLQRSNIRLRDYAEHLDGLILQGGADVSPQAYGEQPLRPEWAGDPVRDAYEMELLHEFMEARKPVLGICRGMQLINVALGGSLHQDLPSQRPGSVLHESEQYDHNIHAITFRPGGALGRWFGGGGGQVVSIHHQAINRPGKDISIEAHADDGEVEAICWQGDSFVCGVQWHPEFHGRPDDGLLDCTPLLQAFLDAAHTSRPPKV